MKKRPTAIGCYIFAGGFTLGVRKHFDVLAHYEDGPYGTETAQLNIPELRGRVFTDPKTWPVFEHTNKVDFIYTNPPCAPWSRASVGREIHWTEDPRLNMVKRAYGLVRLLPEVWAWESVRPAWTQGRELVESIVRHAIDRGYSATVLLVNGIWHDVPQMRKRFFLVLHRRTIEWKPTGVKHPRTVRQAFAKSFRTNTVASLSPHLLELTKLTNEGEELRDVFERLHPEAIGQSKVAGRPSFQRRRLKNDAPSYVLTGGPLMIHPTRDRLITIEESAALCGYPRSFRFIGGISSQYAQVAQAVMPPVGEYLARMVAGSLGARLIKKPYFEQVEVFGDRLERQNLIPIGGAMDLTVKEN